MAVVAAIACGARPLWTEVDTLRAAWPSSPLERREQVHGQLASVAARLNAAIPPHESVALVAADRESLEPAVFLNARLYPRVCRIYEGRAAFERDRDAVLYRDSRAVNEARHLAPPTRVVSVDAKRVELAWIER